MVSIPDVIRDISHHALGFSRVLLFETVQRVMTRMNTLMILGEDAGTILQAGM
jgi:hypothetical protein